MTVRVTKAEVAALDAARGKLSRSTYLRRIISAATSTATAGNVGLVDYDEALALMSDRARNGSTAAITQILQDERARRKLAELKALTIETAEPDYDAAA